MLFYYYGKKSSMRMKGLSLTGLFLSATLTVALSPAAHAIDFRSQLENSVFGQAGRKHSIDPYLIYAVALVESAHGGHVEKGFVSPHLYAVRSSKGAAYPKSKAEASVVLQSHIQGAKSLREIDVCLMQVNLGWNGHRVSKYENLFDLEVCVDAGAAILKENLASTNNLYEAIGRYNTWGNREAANKYAIKVVDIYNRLPR